MCNEQMNPLNTTDGWEYLVNGNNKQRGTARERVAAWKKARRLRKLWMVSSLLATISITFVVLGATGAVCGWLSTAIAVGFLVSASILLGRYMEAKK